MAPRLSRFGPGCCCLPYCFTVKDCHGSPLEGAHVVFKQGGITVFEADTPSDGKICFTFDSKASVSVTVTKEDWKDGSATFVPSQGGSSTIYLSPDPDEATFTVYVYKCNTSVPPLVGPITLPNGSVLIGGPGPLTYGNVYPFMGKEVFFTTSAGVEGSAITDSSGMATFTVHHMGTTTITIPDANPYVGAEWSKTFTTTCNSYSYSVILAPDVNHICCGGAMLPTVVHVSTGDSTVDATRQGPQLDWLACANPTDIVAATCTGSCRCPDTEEKGVACQISWNCSVDLLTQQFTGLHVHIYWHAGTCVTGWTGAVPGAGNPICGPTVYYSQCDCPWSLSYGNDCVNTCPCPVPGTQPMRGYVWNQLTFDIPAADISYEPFSVTFNAGTFTLPCTSPGATGTPLSVPPPGGGTWTLSE